MKKVYLIGSLTNKSIPNVAQRIRALGSGKAYDVFDDWYSAGPEADRFWEQYEQNKGLTFEEALHGRASRNVVSFDWTNLMRADIAVLLLPAGKSGHLEAGMCIGMGMFRDLRVYIVLEEESPRWDQMYGLTHRTILPGDVVRGTDALIGVLDDLHESGEN